MKAFLRFLRFLRHEARISNLANVAYQALTSRNCATLVAQIVNLPYRRLPIGATRMKAFLRFLRHEARISNLANVVYQALTSRNCAMLVAQIANLPYRRLPIG